MKKFYLYILPIIAGLWLLFWGQPVVATTGTSMQTVVDSQPAYQSGNCTIRLHGNELSVPDSDFEINTTFSNLPKHSVQKAAFMVVTMPEPSHSESFNPLDRFGDTLIDLHIGYSPQEKSTYVEFKLRGSAVDDSNETQPIYFKGDTLYLELIRKQNTYYGYYSIDNGPKRLAGSTMLPRDLQTKVNYFVRGNETKDCISQTEGESVYDPGADRVRILSPVTENREDTCQTPIVIRLEEAPNSNFDVILEDIWFRPNLMEEAGIMILSTDEVDSTKSNWLRIFVYKDATTPSNSTGLWLTNALKGELEDSLLQVADFSTGKISFKLERRQSVYNAYYRVGQSTWTYFNTFEFPFSTNLQIGVYKSDVRLNKQPSCTITRKSDVTSLWSLYNSFQVLPVVADLATASTQATASIQTAALQESAPLAVVQVAGLNVREGPSTSFPRFETLKQGETAKIITATPGCGWFQVQTPRGSVGWISGSSQYSRLNVTCDQIQTARANEIPADPAPNPTVAPTAVPTQVPATAAEQNEDPDADKGCYRFVNGLGAELNVTLTAQEWNWNKTFAVPHGTEYRECLGPGRYTYTFDAPPPWGSSNGEIKAEAGNHRVWTFRK